LANAADSFQPARLRIMAERAPPAVA